MRDPWTAFNEFWKAYAEAFVQPLQANGLLSRFTNNPNVTGAYGETWVRSMTRNMIGHRFRVSTGTVIRSQDSRREEGTPQCDLIVWDPSEMPALFESGEFAIIPLHATRAIIEVKRKGTKEDLSQQLIDRRQLLFDLGPVLGVIINHPVPLFDQKCGPHWLEERDTTEPPLTRLLNDNNAPDFDGIMAFIYFLAQVAGHTSQKRLNTWRGQESV